MYTPEELKQIEQLRWNNTSVFETHIRPVDGGFIVDTVERFVDISGCIVAQANVTKVITDGDKLSDYISEIYSSASDAASDVLQFHPKDQQTMEAPTEGLGRPWPTDFKGETFPETHRETFPETHRKADPEQIG